jgi:Zn-dependent peptidase ImmA (M78 family)
VTEFRGFVLVDEYAPLVFINGADGKAAQMFTLAHELAHVWFGRSAAFDLRDLQPANERTELACNSVAAEFLVPKTELQRSWPTLQQDPEPFQAIARQFKVSALVGARRALDLQLISRVAGLQGIGVSGAPPYVLDANVFIEAARRYYALDLAPGFWQKLTQYASAGAV